MDGCVSHALDWVDRGRQGSTLTAKTRAMTTNPLAWSPRGVILDSKKTTKRQNIHQKMPTIVVEQIVSRIPNENRQTITLEVTFPSKVGSHPPPHTRTSQQLSGGGKWMLGVISGEDL